MTARKKKKKQQKNQNNPNNKNKTKIKSKTKTTARQLYLTLENRVTAKANHKQVLMGVLGRGLDAC